ncbi:MAG: alkaline phosphatase PhoX [Synechococcus sp.]|nr:alkaline phosphatase PhoX [Synechococcus sp.]
MQRRSLLLQLLGFGAAGLVGPALAGSRRPGGAAPPQRPFEPLPAPLPLPGDGLPAEAQRRAYARLALEDRLVVPPGYRADLLLAWGDPLGSGRFGFNNDYLALLPLAPERALLTVNFEYISAVPWCAGYAEVSGEQLPFEAVKAGLAERGGSVDARRLEEGDPLRQAVQAVATAALNDLGLGVVELERQASGAWRPRPGRHDRRITGLSGWRDPQQRLRVSGPAAPVFRRADRLGFNDGLGDAVIGTFGNCAGGQTPWGTVLSAEENVQTHVVEAVYADGSSPDPAACPFRFDGNRLEGLGNPFGLAGNKYGWMVEVDPRRPERPAVKHSWLGRFRHEAVAVRAVAGEPLVVYSGCDRHGGHVYRFVSDEPVGDPADPANSRLLERGRLEVARFDPPAAPGGGGRGRWIPLAPDTPLNPMRPSHFARFGRESPVPLPHSDRSRAGAEDLRSDAEVEAYCLRFPDLGSLYAAAGENVMGAILIDVHLAANAVGATPAARPEDTELDPRTGDLLLCFTAGGADSGGRADPAIFHGPAGEPDWPYGWVMRLQEEPGAAAFRWRMVATGGTPWQGGMGFSNPDNLAIDRAGNVWMVTDRSTRTAALDVFGNNACWLFRAAAPDDPLLFATGPMECELTGPCFDAEETTLFLAVQHPGEDNGSHHSGQQEIQVHRLVDRRGRPFEQLRTVPLGSNWPSGVPGRVPRPGVVAIRRREGGPLLPVTLRPLDPAAG